MTLKSKNGYGSEIIPLQYGYDLLQEKVVGNDDQLIFIRPYVCIERLNVLYSSNNRNIFINDVNTVAHPERGIKEHDDTRGNIAQYRPLGKESDPDNRKDR